METTPPEFAPNAPAESAAVTSQPVRQRRGWLWTLLALTIGVAHPLLFLSLALFPLDMESHVTASAVASNLQSIAGLVIAGLGLLALIGWVALASVNH